MRLTIAKVAFAAVLPLFIAAPALADEQHDKLMKACTENDPAPASCECQVKVLEDNLNAKLLKVFIATMEAAGAATPEEAQKAGKAALDEAGMTQEEFEKAMGEAMEKVNPAMEACKKS